MSKRFTITPSATSWIVRAQGAELARSDHALELRDGDHPAVIFFPPEDVAMVFFDPSPTQTARHAGHARHLTLVGPERQIADAAWSLEAPEPAFETLAGHVAFDAERVTLVKL